MDGCRPAIKMVALTAALHSTLGRFATTIPTKMEAWRELSATVNLKARKAMDALASKTRL
jgi:hypothetical protein